MAEVARPDWNDEGTDERPHIETPDSAPTTADKDDVYTAAIKHTLKNLR